MFSIDLTSSGYRWSCTVVPCETNGTYASTSDAVQQALDHRNKEHPGYQWNARYQEACRVAEVFLKDRDLHLWRSDGEHAQPLVLNELVAALSVALTPPGIVLPQAAPPVDNSGNWGKNPFTMDNMHDPRLIEMPTTKRPFTSRNWTTNHQVRWSVGEAINMPPEGSGCKETGARVGEDREVCALPKHNAANVAHVFALGGLVSRIACN